MTNGNTSSQPAFVTIQKHGEECSSTEQKGQRWVSKRQMGIWHRLTRFHEWDHDWKGSEDFWGFGHWLKKQKGILIRNQIYIFLQGHYKRNKNSLKWTKEEEWIAVTFNHWNTQEVDTIVDEIERNRGQSRWTNEFRG